MRFSQTNMEDLNKRKIEMLIQELVDMRDMLYLYPKLQLKVMDLVVDLQDILVEE